MPGRDNQSQRGHQHDRYRSAQHQGGQYQSGGYPDGQYQGGGDHSNLYQSAGYYNGGYPGNGYRSGQYQASSTGRGYPAIPPPSARTLAAIRSADQRNAAALSQQPAGLSQTQATEQYLHSTTSNLDPPDRGTARSSSYMYPTTMIENFDQRERRQERDIPSSISRDDASGRYPQERRQERSTSERSSRDTYTSSNSRERRPNRSNPDR